MVVRVKRGQLNYFRKKARGTPNEIYAVLVGRVLGKSLIEIIRFAYPALKLSTPCAVDPYTSSLQEIYDEAFTEGLDTVGSIHSHPNWLPVMSQTDHKYHKDSGDKVCAIVEVTKGRTRVVFWRNGTPLPCKIEYCD